MKGSLILFVEVVVFFPFAGEGRVGRTRGRVQQGAPSGPGKRRGLDRKAP